MDRTTWIAVCLSWVLGACATSAGKMAENGSKPGGGGAGATVAGGSGSSTSKANGMGGGGTSAQASGGTSTTAGGSAGTNGSGVATTAGKGGSAGSGSSAAGSPGDMTSGTTPGTKAGDTVGDFTYYQVDGAICRDGSPAGYYLRKGTSKNLAIFLNGGGVCFDDFFCGINPSNVDQSLPGEDLFGATLDQISSALLPVRQTPPDEGLLKKDPTNPVSEWSMVFVPYCTGDVYAGTTRDSPVTTSTSLPAQQFVGYTNLGLFYQTLATTIGAEVMSSEKVLLSGSSAGGFGALMNFDRTQEFFNKSKVYAVTDSGFPFRDQYLEPCLQKEWRELWGLDKILPKDCTGCFNADGGGLADGLGTYIFKQKYKGRVLGGGISSTQDQIIKLFFSAGLGNCTTDTATEAVSSFVGGSSYPPDRYPAGLQDFLDNVAGEDSVGSYFIDSDLHQHLFRARFYEQNGVGKTIAQWLGDVLNDQAEHLGTSGASSGGAGSGSTGGAGTGP